MTTCEYCPQCGNLIINFDTCDTCGFNLHTGYAKDNDDIIDDYSDDNWACGTLDPND